MLQQDCDGFPGKKMTRKEADYYREQLMFDCKYTVDEVQASIYEFSL